MTIKENSQPHPLDLMNPSTELFLKEENQLLETQEPTFLISGEPDESEEQIEYIPPCVVEPKCPYDDESNHPAVQQDPAAEELGNNQVDSSDKSDPQPIKETTTSANTRFSTSTKYRASSRAMAPFVFISVVFVLLAQFPDFLTSLFAKPEQLAEMPEFISANMGIGLSLFLYGLSMALFYFGLKQVLQGTLEVFDDYVRYKTGILKNKKILYVDLISVAVHKAPFSSLFDIGDIELSSSTKEIRLKNVANPSEVQSHILEKQQEFIFRKKI